MNGYRHFLVERDGPALWARINRPASRNALSRGTLQELARICTIHADDPAVKALVITGTGDAAFAAGGDLKELASVRSAGDAGAFFDESSSAIDCLRSFPVPTLAALNGLAVGGGAELAVACDFRVASPAAAIGFIHGSLNISCGFGGGADLVRILGPAAAMAHGLRAKAVPAARALEIGLVDQVAGRDESLEDCARRFLEPMLRQTGEVVRAYKAFCIAGRDSPHARRDRELERDWFVRTWTHPDHWNAVDAIARKWREKAE